MHLQNFLQVGRFGQSVKKNRFLSLFLLPWPRLVFKQIWEKFSVTISSGKTSPKVLTVSNKFSEYFGDSVSPLFSPSNVAFLISAYYSGPLNTRVGISSSWSFWSKCPKIRFLIFYHLPRPRGFCFKKLHKIKRLYYKDVSSVMLTCYNRKNGPWSSHAIPMRFRTFKKNSTMF